MAKRDPQALAERLSKYADALTAFAVVESVAFFFNLGNIDFRHVVIHPAHRSARSPSSPLFLPNNASSPKWQASKQPNTTQIQKVANPKQ
jgi:hypothetical protein